MTQLRVAKLMMLAFCLVHLPLSTQLNSAVWLNKKETHYRSLEHSDVTRPATAPLNVCAFPGTV